MAERSCYSAETGRMYADCLLLQAMEAVVLRRHIRHVRPPIGHRSVVFGLSLRSTILIVQPEESDLCVSARMLEWPT